MQCPQLHPLRILSGKWEYLTLRNLQHAKRFSEIQSDLVFITNKTLSIVLGTLEHEGLIEHRDERYTRTVKGNELVRATKPLATWCEKHYPVQSCGEDQSCRDCAFFPTLISQR